MAVFHSTPVTCTCGNTFDVDLARSVNVRRSPAVRGKILRGEFHRALCPACGAGNAIERPFYYSDPLRQSVFFVQGRSARYNHERDGRQLSKQARECSLLMDGKDPTQMRVVYGLDELREKLVAQDAGFDDRHVELLKLFVIHEHPFLLKTPRLQIVLAAATPTQLEFLAYHYNQTRTYQIQLSRFLAEHAVNQPEKLEKWVASSKPKESILAPDRRWVNFRRWTTRYSALDTLRDFAATVNAGKPIDLKSNDFVTMCKRLPRASELPEWAKADVRTLFECAKSKKNGKAQDLLFEVRFGIKLDDEWATNDDPNDIDTIWNLLRNVPIDNIERNVKLKEIQLGPADEDSTYWTGTIQISAGELSGKERFEDVLRHEVGHAVHEDKATLVDPWLTETFGWRHFAKSQAGINRWVELMGGWNAWGPVTASQRIEISNALYTRLGNPGKWEPAALPNFPAGHPWHRKGFGPRKATVQSKDTWYDSYTEWYRINGLAFFLNYWYAELYVVKESTLDLIKDMGKNYAAMSHYEFFAELYALYYNIDDPDRKVIPADVAKWLDDNVGVPSPANPAPTPTKTKGKKATAKDRAAKATKSKATKAKSTKSKTTKSKSTKGKATKKRG